MNILMEYWLSAFIGIFLLLMVLYGHRKGFLRIALSFSALTLSLLTVQFAAPVVTTYLQKNTQISQVIGKTLLKTVESEFAKNGEMQALMEIQNPALQKEIVEHLNIPEQIKQVILENNNRESYRHFHVEKFVDYVSAYLSSILLKLIVSVVLFLIVNIGLRVLILWLNLFARLPILHGINQLAGAVLGGVQGLLFVWLFFLAVQLCTNLSWSAMVLSQIQKSAWLNFLYENNLLGLCFMSILGKIG